MQQDEGYTPFLPIAWKAMPLGWCLGSKCSIADCCNAAGHAKSLVFLLRKARGPWQCSCLRRDGGEEVLTCNHLEGLLRSRSLKSVRTARSSAVETLSEMQVVELSPWGCVWVAPR